MNAGQYAKTITTIIAAGLGILVAALSDDVVSAVEFVNIVIAIVTAVGVYLVPNLPEGPARYLKTIVAFAGAALATLALILGESLGFGDVTSADWLTVLLAGLTVIGVYVIPNVSRGITNTRALSNDPTFTGV
jgi:hypothetical protein